jgi:hypothetical protein
MENEIVNKVALSSLVSLDLEALYPTGERVLFDLKPLLFEELILKEKDFRAFLKEHNWLQYQGKHVAITCTADAIVPTWAFMLIALKLEPYASTIHYGNIQSLEDELWAEDLNKLDLEPYKGAKVVIKGCSKIEVPVSAYVKISKLLRPITASVMYGEPCSTVPLYKADK